MQSYATTFRAVREDQRDIRASMWMYVEAMASSSRYVCVRIVKAAYEPPPRPSEHHAVTTTPSSHCWLISWLHRFYKIIAQSSLAFTSVKAAPPYAVCPISPSSIARSWQPNSRYKNNTSVALAFSPAHFTRLTKVKSCSSPHSFNHSHKRINAYRSRHVLLHSHSRRHQPPAGRRVCQHCVLQCRRRLQFGV